MILKNSVQLWEMRNPDKHYFDAITLNEKLDRRTLFNFLMSEYQDMQTVESNSETFYQKVLLFFSIHEWNINKLTESLYFVYEPLDNFRWRQTLEREEDKDMHEDEVSHQDLTDSTAHFVSAYNDVPSPKTVGPVEEGDRLEYADTEDNRSVRNLHDDQNRQLDYDHTVNTGENILRTGHSDLSFQQLIEEERKQAEFNIYKWIAKHFSRELLLCLW